MEQASEVIGRKKIKVVDTEDIWSLNIKILEFVTATSGGWWQMLMEQRGS